MSAAAGGTRRRAAPIRVGSAVAPVAFGRGIPALLGWVSFAALGWGVLIPAGPGE